MKTLNDYIYEWKYSQDTDVEYVDLDNLTQEQFIKQVIESNNLKGRLISSENGIKTYRMSDKLPISKPPYIDILVFKNGWIPNIYNMNDVGNYVIKYIKSKDHGFIDFGSFVVSEHTLERAKEDSNTFKINEKNAKMLSFLIKSYVKK